MCWGSGAVILGGVLLGCWSVICRAVGVLGCWGRCSCASRWWKMDWAAFPLIGIIKVMCAPALLVVVLFWRVNSTDIFMYYISYLQPISYLRLYKQLLTLAYPL